jgi:predicted O-methyltransferase YrrM
LIGDAPRSAITGVPGWESADEQAYLFQLAQNVPDGGQIVEIGAEYGMSSSLFCKGAKPSVKITSIDLFPGDLLAKHSANLKEAGFGERTTKIQANSAYYDWKQGPISLLFIDGDHNYEGCKADIERFVKFVEVGGIVAFHDCANAANLNPHHMHYFVTRAVSEWFWSTAGKWKSLAPVNTILSFERIK